MCTQYTKSPKVERLVRLFVNTKMQTKIPGHLQNMSLVDTVAVDVAFCRAEWIGYGVLWPRAMLQNAGAWGPQQNREYHAAYDAQKKDIEEAVAHETSEMKCRRIGDAAVPYQLRHTEQQQTILAFCQPSECWHCYPGVRIDLV